MDIFLKNWIPLTLLLCLSVGAWLVGFLLTRKSGQKPQRVLIGCLSAVSLLSNLALIVVVLASGGGIEHVIAVLLFSLLVTLH